MRSAPSGRRDEFADSYISQSEQALGPIYPVLAYSVLRLVPEPLAGKTVLDLGGGTGQWLGALLDRGLGRGILIDEDEAMSVCAHRRLSSSRAVPGCLVIQARAEAIPLGPATVHLVVSRNSMHLWHDLSRAWAEIGRILAPGGWVFLGRGFGPDLSEELRQQVKQARRALRDPGGTPGEEPPSPSPAEVASLAGRAGIAEVAVVPDHKSWWFLGRRRI